jgi:hypothetical protein
MRRGEQEEEVNLSRSDRSAFKLVAGGWRLKHAWIGSKLGELVP